MAQQSEQSGDAVEVLRAVWDAQGGDSGALLDDDCSPTKSCKNMRTSASTASPSRAAISRGAWRDKLAREGKLATSGGSVRDLVLGPSESR